MVRKSGVLGIAIIGIISLLLIVFNQKNPVNYYHYHQPPSSNLHVGISLQEALFDSDNSDGIFDNSQQNDKKSMDDIVDEIQEQLRQELIDYRFPKSTNIDNFTLLTNGQPLRSVIITTWRSGSTFLGEVLNSIPGNFYHYEPLLDYGIVRIRGEPLSRSAIQNLKDLLNCDYTNLQHYIDFGKQHLYLFSHNTRLWQYCDEYPHYCFNATFLTRFCRQFPFQSLKTVRLKLQLAEELLNDPTLNVKVLLLIRDPRGTLQSRKHRRWCPGQPDCDKPTALCGDLVDDYKAASYLKKTYPGRFRVLRYEDLSLEPYKHVEELFKFFNLDFHQQVKDFLNTHTIQNIGGVSSTFRDSKTAPFHWRFDLNFTEVDFIQQFCSDALHLWGYIQANNEQHLHQFNPITNYTIL